MWQTRLDSTSTIFAVASGSLPSAVAIVRLSGPDAFSIGAKLFSSPLDRVRGLHVGKLRDSSSQFLDDIVLLSFVGPRSDTGEDTLEFQCHGSVSIVRRLESSLQELGARPAERGEFSYRAFLNGKLSAEGLDLLGDLFVAREPADLDRLYRRRDGALEDSIAILRNHLLRTQAILDTAVDFSEEYSAVLNSAREPLDLVIRECSSISRRYSLFRQPGTVPKIVLAGRPNAGKSSLFNALLCRYRAIVHPEPGTTRDVIEEDVSLGERTWKLVDTAGIRTASGAAEKEGIELGETFLGASAFWILVVDGTCGMSEAEERLLEKYGNRPHLIAWNKNDSDEWRGMPHGAISLSARTGVGIPELGEHLKEGLRKTSTDDSAPLPTSTQSARLQQVVGILEEMKRGFDLDVPPEVLAEMNRRAMGVLESVIGAVTIDDVLDRVFGEFCIGK